MTEQDLAKCDIVLLVDKSGSMEKANRADNADGPTRWQTAEEMAESIAAVGSKYDTDGITVGVFSGDYHIHENVQGGVGETEKLFKQYSPGGTTATHKVLGHVWDDYAKRKKANGSETKRMLVAIVTDGEPDDRNALEQLIIDISRKVEDEDEFQIHFMQVGDDAKAHQYLKHLDTELKGKAKFDIVGVRTFEEMNSISILDAILANDE